MRFSMGGRRGGARPGRPRVRSARSAAACSPMLLRAGLPCVLLPQLLVMSSLLAVSGRQGRGGVSVSAHSRLSRRSAAHGARLTVHRRAASLEPACCAPAAAAAVDMALASEPPPPPALQTRYKSLGGRDAHAVVFFTCSYIHISRRPLTPNTF